MKMLVYTLLIAVVFLTGILLGATNNQFLVQAPNQQVIESDDVVQEAAPVHVDQDKQDEVTPKSTVNQEDASKNTTVIEKAALMIEETSVWIYDQIIQVAYYISEIFV